jgi:transposase
MRTTATQNAHYNVHEPVLFMAFELSEKTWKLGFTLSHGQPPRERTIAARDTQRLLHEVAHAKARLGLGAPAPVVSGYAAGRAGFWLHRFVQVQGITNHVVDSSSIEGHRRKRRAKSDGLDVRKVLTMLMRYHYGERHGWRVVNVPSVAAEEQRPLHRDLETLKQERARTSNRIKGWLSRQGIRRASVHKVPEPLDALRLWDGSPVPKGSLKGILSRCCHRSPLARRRRLPQQHAARTGAV